jgi:hypothetical protein
MLYFLLTFGVGLVLRDSTMRYNNGSVSKPARDSSQPTVKVLAVVPDDREGRAGQGK